MLDTVWLAHPCVHSAAPAIGKVMEIGGISFCALGKTHFKWPNVCRTCLSAESSSPSLYQSPNTILRTPKKVFQIPCTIKYSISICFIHRRWQNGQTLGKKKDSEVSGVKKKHGIDLYSITKSCRVWLVPKYTQNDLFKFCISRRNNSWTFPKICISARKGLSVLHFLPHMNRHGNSSPAVMRELLKPQGLPMGPLLPQGDARSLPGAETAILKVTVKTFYKENYMCPVAY